MKKEITFAKRMRAKAELIDLYCEYSHEFIHSKKLKPKAENLR